MVNQTFLGDNYVYTWIEPSSSLLDERSFLGLQKLSVEAFEVKTLVVFALIPLCIRTVP